jgi:hypothetical protein
VASLARRCRPRWLIWWAIAALCLGSSPPLLVGSAAVLQDDGKTAAEVRREDENEGEASEERASDRHAEATRPDDGDQVPPEPEPTEESGSGSGGIRGEGEEPPDDEPDDPTPDVPPDDGTETGLQTYVSPTWGYALTYDATVWEPIEESSEGGFDRLNLYNGPSYVWIWGMAGYSGDPVACRDDWVRVLRTLDGIESFAPLLDQDGEPLAGQDEGSAFAVYGYTSVDGNEVFDVRCLTLVPGLGNLVIVLETFASRYEEQAAAVAELLTGLDLSGVRTPDAEELTGGAADVEVGEVRRPADEDVDQIVIVDSFNDPNRGRLSVVSPDPSKVRYAYEDGEYVIETLDPNAGIWQAGIEGAYADVAIAIDVRLVGETAGRLVALGCRYSLTGGQATGYALLANPAAGTVALFRYDGAAVALTDAVASGAFLPAVEQNRLELSCVGTTIKATVNGQVVVTVEDATYASGYLFIAAGTQDAPGTVDARSDNLLITIFGD